jgi:hypothetical protein
MTGRARLLILVWIPSLVTLATSGRAQTPVEQKVNAFVEELRGRASEATFENGRYCHAGMQSMPAGWNWRHDSGGPRRRYGALTDRATASRSTLG